MIDRENSFDKAIEIILFALLAFMPFAFGVVHAWSEQVVVVLSMVMCVVFLIKIVLEGQKVYFTWAYIPIAFFVLLAVIQLISLPTAVVSSISPNTAAIKSELLSDLSSGKLGSMTLSFYPNATKHDLRLLIALAAVFFVVFNYFRDAERIKRLLTVIALIGGAVAVLALLQALFGNGKIYWSIDPGVGLAYSGPFVNHSHFGQFMNLSIAAAVGLIFIKFHEAFTGKKIEPVDVFEYLGSREARWIWILVGISIAGIVTIFVSLTRGGIISLLIAGAFTTLVLSSRRSLEGRGWIMALMALGAFICVLYVGFDAVYERLATLRELHDAQGGRLQIVKDISVAWTRFPVFGTGLGTHEVVYPMFDRSTIAALASHAENEYAQAAEETGALGLLSLAAFSVLVWIAYVKNIRTSKRPISSCAYGLGFGLLAIMIHSLSDFGQHLPANSTLSIIYCALLLALAGGVKSNPGPKPVKNNVVWMFVCVVLIGALGWSALAANRARLAERHWEKARLTEQVLRDNSWQGSNEQYIELIGNAAQASNYQTDNVKYAHWLNVYRWHSMSRLTDPNTGEIILPEPSMKFVKMICDELNQARWDCPVYGAVYCIVGQLEKYILQDSSGSERIRQGYRLAPCDPTACFVAGKLDAEEGSIDGSFEKMSRAVKLNPLLFKETADYYIVSHPDLAVALAEENIGRLSYVANSLVKHKVDSELAEQVRGQVVDLLKAKCEEPDVKAWTLASLANVYRSQGNIDKAIEYYRRALTLDYGQISWRLTLARLLADQQRIDEAIHEAKICLRLQPEYEPAKRLIAELSVLTP